jgi:hypothetical protein
MQTEIRSLLLNLFNRDDKKLSAVHQKGIAVTLYTVLCICLISVCLGLELTPRPAVFLTLDLGVR